MDISLALSVGGRPYPDSTSFRISIHFSGGMRVTQRPSPQFHRIVAGRGIVHCYMRTESFERTKLIQEFNARQDKPPNRRSQRRSLVRHSSMMWPLSGFANN